MTGHLQQAISTIRSAAPSGFRPKYALVLGSGLGGYADLVEKVSEIPYVSLPGFPQPGVGGHAGRLVLGYVGGCPVAIMQGRAHYYEHGRADSMSVPIQVLKEIGAEGLLLTNASGSLRPDMPPGSIMLVIDHINFTGTSPLFGYVGDSRFVDMVDAYDPALRRGLQEATRAKGITLHEGTYIWFCGPSFETPAEIRAARALGADAVGMSTVPEVILARYFGMPVAALSVITNAASGLGSLRLSHEQTQAVARQAFGSVSALLTQFFSSAIKQETT
jgi:purine-nucleoside phosphorylase